MTMSLFIQNDARVFPSPYAQNHHTIFSHFLHLLCKALLIFKISGGILSRIQIEDSLLALPCACPVPVGVVDDLHQYISFPQHHVEQKTYAVGVFYLLRDAITGLNPLYLLLQEIEGIYENRHIIVTSKDALVGVDEGVRKKLTNLI